MRISEEDLELLEYIADLVDHIDRRAQELRGLFNVRAAS